MKGAKYTDKLMPAEFETDWRSLPEAVYPYAKAFLFPILWDHHNLASGALPGEVVDGLREGDGFGKP